MKNAPKTIYLIVDDENHHIDNFELLDTETVLWSENPIFEKDIEYVSKEAVKPVIGQLETLINVLTNLDKETLSEGQKRRINKRVHNAKETLKEFRP